MINKIKATVLGSLFFAPLVVAQPLESISAVVNNEIVLQTELDEMQQVITKQIKANSSGRLPPAHLIRQQVLERLILMKIQTQRANLIGLGLDESQITKTIERMAQKNGQTLEEFIDQQNANNPNAGGYKALRKSVHDEVLVAQLRQREVDRRIQITEREIDDAYDEFASQGQDAKEYRLRQILIAIPTGATAEVVADKRATAAKLYAELQNGADFFKTAASHSDGQNALQGGELGWRKLSQVPSIFVDAVRDAKKGYFSNVLRSGSGFHIVQVADLKGGLAVSGKERKSRHILIRSDAPKSDKKAYKRIQDIYQELKAGGNFAKLASEHSEDPGTASEGGALGWAATGQFVAEFEVMLSRLKPNELSQPFSTQFGWHVVQLLDVRESDPKEAIRQYIRQQIWQRKLAEETERWVRKLRDEAYVEIREKPADS